MSIQPPPVGVPVIAPLPHGSVPCPRCGEVLSAAQDWCLNCGDPARTVLAPTPRWRWLVAVLCTMAALSLGVLAAAFVGISSDDPPPSRTTTSIVTTQPGVVPAPAPAPGSPGVTGAAGTSGATGAKKP